jgi:hypothetical protein
MDIEASISRAINAVNDGSSIRAAAIDFDVPYPTLRRRIRGGKSRQERNEDLQFLTTGQEEELIKLILYMASLGLPPTAGFIQKWAAELTGRQIQRSWFQRFIARHKEIKHIKAKKLETSRAAVTSTEITEFFADLRDIIAKNQIDYRDIWNMDETGTHFGESANRIHIYASTGSKKGRTLTLPENGRLVSSIEAISADGRTIPPYFIQKGVLFEEHQLPAEEDLQTKRYFMARTKGGFSTRETGLDWLYRVFIPYTRSDRGLRLLILDGHVSHTAEAFWQKAWSCGVLILRLPPHSTHLLQPLDLEVFGAFKTSYRSLIVGQQFEGIHKVSSQDFFNFYFRAKELSFTKRLIESSFKTAGLWPINAALSLEKLPRPVTPPILGGNIGDSPSRAPPICDLDLFQQAIENGETTKALEAFKTFKRDYLSKQAEIQTLRQIQKLHENQLKNAKPSTKSKKRLRTDSGYPSINHQSAAASQDIDRSSPLKPDEDPELPAPSEDSILFDSSVVDVESEPDSL